MPRRLDPRRVSLRMPGRDYSSPGLVFVTIDTANRQQLFGHIDDADVHLNSAGMMVVDTWNRVPEVFGSIALDEFIVMPDHTHAILVMGLQTPPGNTQATVGQVVHWFKATTVEAYRQGVLNSDWEPYDGKLWHRNFHDRVLRRGELDIRRRYIQLNPQRRWNAMLEVPASPPSALRNLDWRAELSSSQDDS